MTSLGRGLREAFFMFWVTLWPLILGFSLSGAVQAFASRAAMRRLLGDHGPPAVARATVLGMVSSSCSYAASAISRSLFAQGADFVAVNVFMFASTNLVVELGVVLVVLMGWQFAASEFVGGLIMIALLASVGGLYLRGHLVVAARERLAAGSAGGGTPSGNEPASLPRPDRRSRFRSVSRWADAYSYTMADLRMVRRELLIGYTVAGFLAVLVPVSAWNALFFHGHGLWTSVENAVVGPLVALVSCVCSVGNVPLAAALWHGGISFGGAVAFLFADLIALPLLLIYRRYYGTRLMLRMLAVFWAVMALAGLCTEGLFQLAGLVPQTRPAAVVTDHFSWNYTTWLNFAFLGLLVVAGVFFQRRRPSAKSGRIAVDPVCGMVVEKVHAPASFSRGDESFYFCSERCAERFTAPLATGSDQGPT